MRKQKISQNRMRNVKLGIAAVGLLSAGIASKVILAEEISSSQNLESSSSSTAETLTTVEETSTTVETMEKTETPKESTVPLRRVRRSVATNYQGTVTLVGQWTNESRKKVDTTRDYQSATDKLGAPESNPGSLRGLAKTFLGWSDKPQVGNGQIAEGARLFSAEDTIGLAFPNGINENTKLYAIYFSLNDPNKPWPDNNLSMGFAFLNSAEAFRKAFNDNKVTINGHVLPEDTLPNTVLKKVDTNSSENKTTILDTYKKMDDMTTVNEVVLRSEFEMDKSVAMVVYKNPLGQHYARPILSNDYKQRYESGDFSTESGAKAGYTYVDLKVSLHEGITVPNKLYLNFKGYSWRPIYVLNENKQPLNIFDPKTGASLGNNKNSFNSLVSNTSPNVTFGVETNGAKQIIVRTVLREGDAERIREASVKPSTPNMSIAEEITSNMTLQSLSSSDIKKLVPSLSTQEVNERVVRIADARAKSSAQVNTINNATDTLDVKGTVEGHVFVHAGSINVFGAPMILGGNTALQAINSNVIAVGYVMDFKVTHEFKSGTPGKDLPQAIMDRVPSDVLGVENGTVVTPAQANLSDYEDANLNGKWVFSGWDKESQTISGEDAHFVGTWNFVENPKPIEPEKPEEPKKPETPEKPEEPKTPETPEKPEEPKTPEKPSQPEQSKAPEKPSKSNAKPKVTPKKELPKTGITSPVGSWIASGVMLLGSLGLAIKARKDN